MWPMAPHLATAIDNLVSLCRWHHLHGRARDYSDEIDVETGLPVDPNHPCYQPRPVIVRPTPRRR
jgi:hypothetical protein